MTEKRENPKAESGAVRTGQGGKTTARQEPDFDVSALHEAHSGHRERRQQERRKTDGAQQKRHGRSGLAVALTALILLVAISAIGFLELSVLQEDMARAQKSLESMNMLSGTQFETLQSALDSADQQQGKWAKSVEEKAGFLESEIRKLWVIAHQNNQPKIKALESELTALKKTAKKLDGTLKSQAKKITRIEADEAKLKEGVQALSSVQSRLDEYQIRLDDVPVSLEALTLQIQELTTRADDAAVLLKQLEDYRVQVNRSVDQITEEIRLLKGGGSQPGL